jgi:hypothetical protein
MTPRISMLLGHTVWTRNLRGWSHETLDGGDGAAFSAVTRLAEFLSEAPAERTVVVFEPAGVDHQVVEMPNVNRAAFASLARVRNDHPVVESENLGWGIEHPEPGPGGAFSTLIHSEVTPGLILLRDACARAGCRLCAAWPTFTVAIATARPGALHVRARIVLILTPGYSAIAAFGGGKRSFKGWVGPMSERDWKALSAIIGDFESRPSPVMADPAIRRGSVFVIAEGQPEEACPFWKDLRASGRLEAVVDLEAFAASASRIPPTHPANLVEAFPRPRELDRALTAIAVGGISVAMALGSLTLADGNRRREEIVAERKRAADLEGKVKALGVNKREMDRLRDEAPDGSGSLPFAWYQALVGLSEAIPDALTLTSLTIGRDGDFELEGIVVGPDFEQEKVRASLARRGFISSAGKGWSYDPGSGRLSVGGKYKGPRP